MPPQGYSETINSFRLYFRQLATSSKRGYPRRALIQILSFYFTHHNIITLIQIDSQFQYDNSDMIDLLQPYLFILLMNRITKIITYFYIKTSDIAILNQVPPTYNPNISLISNLGQTKQLNQLINLQSYFSEQLTPRHYTFIARKICQTIKFHQGDKKSRQKQIISSENIPPFLKLVQKIQLLEIKGLSNDELINLVFFSQKISKFKNILQQAGIRQQMIGKQFQQKLLNEINEQKRLKKYKLITIQSLLMSVGQFLKNEQLITFLNHVHICLISQQYCSCLHLTLLSKFIQQVNRKDKEYQQISTKVIQCCYLQVMNQLKETKEFLTARPLIQIFNAFYSLHKAEMIPLLDVILSKLKEDSYDSTLYAIFFEGQYNIFFILLNQIDPKSQSIKQLICKLEENRLKSKLQTGMIQAEDSKRRDSNKIEVSVPKVGFLGKLAKKKIPQRE